MTTCQHSNSQIYFRQDFRFWLEKRPKGTLGQLRVWLKKVHDQCLVFVESDDPPIEETDDIPYPLDEYLNFWAEHDGECFSYRAVNIEEDIMNVEEFIEVLGRPAKLSSFPVLQVA